MDARLFRPEPMRLRDHLVDLHIEDRLTYDAASNTVFMNYAGMRVRSAAESALVSLTQKDFGRNKDRWREYWNAQRK